MAGLDILAPYGWEAFGIFLVIAIVKFLFQRKADKDKIKWVGEQEKKLEELRAEITREHSIFTEILNSYSSSHQFSQPSRIEAVQVLWSNILRTRDLSSFAALFFGSLLEEEYNQVYNNKVMMSGLNALSMDDTFNEMGSIKKNVEEYRPFIGEKLWSLFHLYLILNFRVTFKLIEGRDTKKIMPWHTDDYIKLILKEVLTNDEETLSYIPSGVMGPFQRTTDLFERKMLFEIDKIISGELAAESNFRESKKYHALIKTVNFSRNIKPESIINPSHQR